MLLLYSKVGGWRCGWIRQGFDDELKLVVHNIKYGTLKQGDLVMTDRSICLPSVIVGSAVTRE